jgi:TRAP-type mannitol/chloroaromatic compound transport system substrate-binding protein
LFFNKKAFESLPVHLQHIVESAAARFNIWVISAFEAQNNAYMQKLIHEEKVDVRIFSKEILDALRTHSREILLELVEKDPFYKKVYQSYSTFLAQSQQWADYSEKLYYNNISL